MNMSQFYTSTDHFTIIPAVMLALFGCAILLFDFLIFPDPRQRKWLLIFVVLAEVFTGFGLYQQSAWLAAQAVPELTGFGGSVTVDGFGIFFNWIFLIAALAVALVSYKYLEIAGEHHGEYYGLILLAQCGMYFLAAGTDLVTLFIGLELMALCFYVMVGFLRSEKRSNEAAIKYLLLGAFSTGFLVYGFSILYGMAGSTKLSNLIDHRLRCIYDGFVGILNQGGNIMCYNRTNKKLAVACRRYSACQVVRISPRTDDWRIANTSEFLV